MMVTISLLLVASVLKSSDASRRPSFLPRRHSCGSFASHGSTFDNRGISDLRGGSSIEDDNNDVEDVEKESSVGEDFDDIILSVADGNNNAIAEDDDDDGADDDDDEGESVPTTSKGGAWEEEILKTQEFYGAPQSSSSRADEVQITEKMNDSEESNNDGDVGTATAEDERVFGNAQSASYSVQKDDSDDVEEGDVESTEQLDESDTESDPTNESIPEDEGSDQDDDNLEESEIVKDEPLSESELNALVQEEDDTSAAFPEEEGDEVLDTLVQEEDDTSTLPGAEHDDVVIQESADGMHDEMEQIQDDQVYTTENDVDGEEDIPESSNESADEVKDAVIADNENAEEEEAVESADAVEDPEVDENEALEEEKVYDTGRTSMRQGAQDLMKDLVADEEEEEEDQSALEGKSDIPLEDKPENDTFGQEISSIPDPSLDDIEDDMLVPSWQKAQTAAASNKLVEEGLQRLHRTDGDEPSVPYVITRAMKRVLVEELGYDLSEVKTMRPDVAVVIVGESLTRPDLESLPSRFYNDLEEAVAAIEEVKVEESLKGRIVSRLQKLRKEASRLLADRDSGSIMFMVASLGVALPLIFSLTNHENIKAWDETVPAPAPAPVPEFPSSIEVLPRTDSELSDIIEDDLDESDDKSSASGPQPDDLDKTWLDKLISIVSKPFGA